MAAQPTALVVGASGQMGQALLPRLEAAGYAVVATSRTDAGDSIKLDLADAPSNWQLPERADLCFLLAAETRLAFCEANPEAARQTNVTALLEISTRMAARGAKIILPSTNLVFDGSRGDFSETDAPCPLTVYGKLKVELEEKLFTEKLLAVSVRFSKILSSSQSLIFTWLESLQAGQPVTAFGDYLLSPISMEAAVDFLVTAATSEHTGIFHFSGDQDMSYADAARYLAEKLGQSPSLVAETSAAEKGISPLPAHTTLDMPRTSATLNIAPQPIWPALDRYLKS